MFDDLPKSVVVRGQTDTCLPLHHFALGLVMVKFETCKQTTWMEQMHGYIHLRPSGAPAPRTGSHAISPVGDQPGRGVSPLKPFTRPFHVLKTPPGIRLRGACCCSRLAKRDPHEPHAVAIMRSLSLAGITIKLL